MQRLRFRAALFILLICWLLVSGCHSKEGSTPDHPQLTRGVAMRDVTFRSGALGRQMPYRVFLPDKLISGQRLPVVYLLHGGGGGFRDWSNNSDVSRYAANGLILVMPEGNSSYYMNAVENPNNKYEDYITQDLIADVESRFPAKTGRANRAIVGVSMGGFAAAKLALSQPGLYAFAGAISPAIDVPERRFSWKRPVQWLSFREIFGPQESKERQARDPFRLLQSSDPRVTPYLYLTAGEQEPLLEPIRRFAALLKHRGFAYEFHTRPGGHDWGEWNTQAPECFNVLLKVLDSAQP